MLHRLGFVLAEGWFFLLLAVVLGVWIGWLIWGRDAGLNTDKAEADRLRADLSACQTKGREQSARISALEGEVSAAKAAAKSSDDTARVGTKAEMQGGDLLKSVPVPNAGAAAGAGAGAAPAAGLVSAVPASGASEATKPSTAKSEAAPKASATKTAASKTAAAPKTAASGATGAAVAAPVKAAKPAAVKAPAKPKEPAKPKTLTAPRNGKADDLKLIKGVGPKMEALLHKLGFFHFDQLAAWTAKDVAWVDENLEDFKGRATREDWVQQARDLAAGKPPRKGGEN